MSSCVLYRRKKDSLFLCTEYNFKLHFHKGFCHNEGKTCQFVVYVDVYVTIR